MYLCANESQLNDSVVVVTVMVWVTECQIPNSKINDCIK